MDVSPVGLLPGELRDIIWKFGMPARITRSQYRRRQYPLALSNFTTERTCNRVGVQTTTPRVIEPVLQKERLRLADMGIP
jgi:hypothetical protein